MDFSTFNFNSHIQKVLAEKQFSEPTKIQQQAIPFVMQKRDLLGLAQTGTGKTAAFVLPMLEQLALNKSRKVRALILVPTRELAQQVQEVVRDFGDGLGIKSTCIFGGADMRRQVERLRNGVDVVVACPGRLLDHMDRRTVDLNGLEYLVLDEADQMFDRGFLPSIRQIIGRIPKKRQTLMFSATMPQNINKLAQEILTNPAQVKVDSGAPASTVSHAIYPVSQGLKTDLLVQLLKKTDTDSVLVFVRTKHRAKSVARHLEKLEFSVTSLQGNLSQGRRLEAMRGFRSGEYQIMVATDIAARGIDISSISHVINYDIPDTTEAYTHRIGRTGRAAKTGDALTLVTSADEHIVRSIERVLGKNLERRKMEGFDYKAAPTATMPRQEFGNRGSGQRGGGFRGNNRGSGNRGNGGFRGRSEGGFRNRRREDRGWSNEARS